MKKKLKKRKLKRKVVKDKFQKILNTEYLISPLLNL